MSCADRRHRATAGVKAARAAAATAALVALVAAAAAIGGAGPATRAAEPGAPPMRPDILLVGSSVPELRAAVWMDRGRYRPGDPVTVGFFVSEKVYVYLYRIASSGRTHLILPNRFDMRHLFAAGTHRLPRAGYQLVAGGPPGPQYVQLVAARRPLELAPAQAFWEAVFPLLGDDPARLKAELERRLQATGGDWAAAWTAFWVEPLTGSADDASP